MTNIIRWTARVLSLGSLILTLLFFIGETDPSTLSFTTKEIILLLFFPIGITLGHALSWWREGLGGTVTLLSLVMFYITDKFFSGRFPKGPYFLLFATSGILFLIYWFIEQYQSQPQNRLS